MGTNCLIRCGVVLLVADDQRSSFMTNGHMPPMGVRLSFVRVSSVLRPRLAMLDVSWYSGSSVSPTWLSTSYGGLFFLLSVVCSIWCVWIVWDSCFPYLALQLWMKFLQHVTTNGVSINNIVFVKPSVTLWSDACEYGIWGYNENGIVWRWRIPSAWHGKLTLNLLEYLASVVTIYITILQMGQGSHILTFTDSYRALGWMHKASFEPVNAESHNTVACWIRKTLVSSEKDLY